MITPDIDSPPPTAQKTKLPVETLEEIETIFDPPPGVDSNGWPQTDHYACCLACKSWTPPNHPEAHDHKEGCPATTASSIWADRRSTTRLLEDIDFLLGLVYELSIDARLRGA
jgi:hypothetical protein